MIFFSQPVKGVIPQLGHVKSVGDAFGVGQHLLTRVVERLSHIHTVSVYLRTLLGRHAFQTSAPSRLITPGLDRQHARICWIGQVGQDRGKLFVPLFQTDLVHAHVENHALRINRLGLLQLVLHNTPDRLGRDPQTSGHIFLATADQQPYDVFLEAVGIAGILTLEGRDEILAMMAA